MSDTVPCMNCEDRNINCHSNCKKYTRYKLIHGMIQKKIRNYRRNRVNTNNMYDRFYSNENIMKKRLEYM